MNVASGLVGTVAPVLGVLAWMALAAIAYAYLGYPVLARWVIAPRARSALSSSPHALPLLTVLIPARNEAAVIRERLKNLLAQDYPADRLDILVISDASDDGTDEAVQQVGDPRIRLIRQVTRQGKTAAVNRAVPLAKGEVLVQTDANVLFVPGTLLALARAFDDRETGLVLGEVQFVNQEHPEVAGGEGLYWRWETWIKRIEAERGLLAVANGGIYALRKSLWRPLPTSIAGDAAEPLLVSRAGFRVVVAPQAIALERASDTLAEEFRRKTRIIAQQVACARFIGITTLPARIVFAYVSHKLMRYAVPAFAALALFFSSLAWFLGSVWGGLPALCVLAPVAALPLALLPLPAIFGRPTRLLRYLLMVNLAAAIGGWRGLAGGAPAVWETPASTRQ